MKKIKVLLLAISLVFFGVGSVYALNVPKDHLVSPRWVYSHIHNKNLIIIDVRVPKAYDSGHIPGAVNIPSGPAIMQNYINLPILGNIASPEKITSVYRHAGITNHSVIVFYGGGMSALPAGYSSETRALWTGWFYGLTKLAILNGGLARWMRNKLPVATKPSHPAAGNFKITNIRLNSRATYQNVWKYLYVHNAVLIDARPAAWYKGIDHDPRFIKHGHIPGAINIPFSKFERMSKAGYYEFVTPQQAKVILAKAGVNLGKPVITQCNTGYWASLDWFVIKFMLGKNNVADYNGSWVQYSRIPNAPIADLHIHNYSVHKK
ncbi:MAG: rhodanese-like domain-containing protein [Deltaproteobacteria bacterium]|nr:rhodanese-like domain-containing protein [Deltaproteobacteria bacterium]